MLHEDFQILYDIVPAAGEEEKTQNLVLHALFSSRRCSISVYHTILNKIIRLRHIRFSRDLKKINLTELYTLCPELKKTYSQKHLYWFGPKITLIPEDFFDEKLAEKYLKFNYIIHSDDHIAFQKIKDQNIIALYAYQEKVLRIYKEGMFHHVSHIHIPYLAFLSSSLPEEPRQIFIDMDENSTAISVFVDKQLQLHNIMGFKEPEDLLYHILNFSRHFAVNPEKDKFYISGLIERDQSFYKSLYKYIRYPVLLKTPGSLKLNQSLQNMPGHLFFNLLIASL
jgi:hypothetical protein